MHRFVVLIVVGVAWVSAIKEECLQLVNPPAMGCCKAPPIQLAKELPIKECLDNVRKSPKPKGNCEFELCIGKKEGYIADDGTIDKSALEAVISELFKERPKLVAGIKKNCIDADIKDYGFEGFCEPKKLDHCVYVQYAMSCPEFDDNGPCSEIKSLAEKCAAS